MPPDLHYGLTTGLLRDVDARAHRAALKLTGHDVPKGDHVHHLCEYKPCINPAHLEHKTHSRHLQDHRRQDTAKLTLEQVQTIRERLAAGELQLPLSREYGVTGRVIWQICNDVKWRDDPDAPRQRIVWERNCVECGKPVEGRHDKKFCTQEHQRRWNSRRTWRRAHGLDLDTGQPATDETQAERNPDA